MGPAVIADMALMFGDAPASNWAMRFSGFIAYMVSSVLNELVPKSPVVQSALGLLQWMNSVQWDNRQWSLIHSFVSCFIGDFGL